MPLCVLPFWTHDEATRLNLVKTGKGPLTDISISLSLFNHFQPAGDCWNKL